MREFYPAALVAFDELGHSDALAVLTVGSTPSLGRQLSLSKITAALRRGGRQRRIDQRAGEIQAALRTDQLEAPDMVSEAMGSTVRALVVVAGELTAQIARLEVDLADRFDQHPDAKIIRSLAGVGMIIGARVLGEFGDDPNRYADAKCRKNYAGTSPITRESGKSHVVLARYARNRRLADALHQWAFAALTASPGARAFYDAHRAAGDTHNQALRGTREPARRDPPRLPPPSHPLRRTHRLGSPRRDRRLTGYRPGMSRRRRPAGQRVGAGDGRYRCARPAITASNSATVRAMISAAGSTSSMRPAT